MRRILRVGLSFCYVPIVIFIFFLTGYSQEVKTGKKPEKKKTSLIDIEKIAFGCPYYSAKLKQVACINGFSQEGEDIYYNLNVLDEIGDGVRSIVFNEKSVNEKKPTEANVQKAENFLKENGFIKVKEEFLGDAGIRGPIKIKKLGLIVEVVSEELIFKGRDKTKIFKFHLPIMKPHEAKIITISVMPGTRSVVLTFFNDPGKMFAEGYNRNWNSHVIQIPKNIQ